MQPAPGIWYVTAPQLCPYLPERQERRIFTRVSAGSAPLLDSAFAHAGFRRSRDVFYRPFCPGCSACVSVRILAREFAPGRSCRRILRRNRDVRVRALPPRAGGEQFALLRAYLRARHGASRMAGMSVQEYAAMVEDTHVRTRLLEYRRQDGALLAVSLTDVLQDGLSMTYSFFDPGESRRGLGNFMILEHIERALALALPHVYLGYWVEGCGKMAYKTRFRPVEMLRPDGWRRMEN